jgi:hypothetical protein
MNVIHVQEQVKGHEPDCSQCVQTQLCTRVPTAQEEEFLEFDWQFCPGTLNGDPWQKRTGAHIHLLTSFLVCVFAFNVFTFLLNIVRIRGVPHAVEYTLSVHTFCTLLITATGSMSNIHIFKQHSRVTLQPAQAWWHAQLIHRLGWFNKESVVS